MLRLDAARGQPEDSACVPVNALRGLGTEDEIVIEVHRLGRSPAVVTLRAQAITDMGLLHDEGSKPFAGCPQALNEASYVISLASVAKHSSTLECAIPAVKRKRVAAAPKAEMPLIKVWLRRNAKDGGGIPVPSLAYAEEVLRLYCSALCAFLQESGRERAVVAMESLTEDQEMHGLLLFHALLEPTLTATTRRQLAAAEASIRNDRVRSRAKDAGDAALSAFVDRYGPMTLQTAEKLPDETQKRPYRVYCCPFEMALDLLATRTCIDMMHGVVYMRAKEAWKITCKEASKIPASFRPTSFFLSSASPDIKDWLLSAQGYAEKAGRDEIKRLTGVDPANREWAVQTGPLCSLRLDKTLREYRHLIHEERKQILALLVDSGYSEDEAVQYVWDMMSPDARRKCGKELEGIVKSYFKDKQKGLAKRPVSRVCGYYSSVGGCPWTRCGQKELRDLLCQQKLPSNDVEDLVTRWTAARERYSGAYACEMHFEKLAAARGAGVGLSLRRLTRPSDFIVRLYSTAR